MSTQNASSFLREMTSATDLESAINNNLQELQTAKDKYLDKFKNIQEFDFGAVFPALQATGVITMASDTAKALAQSGLQRLSNGINNQIMSNYGSQGGVENVDDAENTNVVNTGEGFETTESASGATQETSFGSTNSDNLADDGNTFEGNTTENFTDGISETAEATEGVEGASEGAEIATGVAEGAEAGATAGLEATAGALTASGVGSLVGVVLAAVAGLTSIGIESYKETHQSSPSVIRPVSSFQLGINA